MINQLIGIISGGCLAYGVFKVVDSFTRYTEAKENYTNTSTKQKGNESVFVEIFK